MERLDGGQLLPALAKVRDAVPYLKKDLTVGSGNWGYKAVGIEQIVSAIRPAMAKQGLLMWPSETEIVAEDFYQSNNKTLRRVTVRIIYTLAHAGGEAIKVAGVGEGADVGDKGIPKACTGAFKQCLRQLLQIESGENDPDVIHSEDLAGKPTRNRKKPSKSNAEALDAAAVAKARIDMAEKIRAVLRTSPDMDAHDKTWKRALERKKEFQFADEEWLPIEAAYNEHKEYLTAFDKKG